MTVTNRTTASSSRSTAGEAPQVGLERADDERVRDLSRVEDGGDVVLRNERDLEVFEIVEGGGPDEPGSAREVGEALVPLERGVRLDHD